MQCPVGVGVLRACISSNPPGEAIAAGSQKEISTAITQESHWKGGREFWESNCRK